MVETFWEQLTFNWASETSKTPKEGAEKANNYIFLLPLQCLVAIMQAVDTRLQCFAWCLFVLSQVIQV